MNKAGRIRRIEAMLSALTGVRDFVRNRRNEKLFELECYLKTATLVASMHRRPIPENLGPSGRFEPLYNPGRLRNRSYLRFENVGGEGDDVELFINVSVESSRRGRRVAHSPDIVLMGNRSRVLSIYECKFYARMLPPSVYREFIGFLSELQPSMVGQAFVRTTPEICPRIYTTAAASSLHAPIPEYYGFIVQDKMP